MACDYPRHVWRARYGGPFAERRIVFKEEDGIGKGFEIPCGRCTGCRLEHSRQWAMRCMHEASLHESNAFITLTYADESLPSDGSLVKHHYQDFMKRFRARIAPRRIRFFACGEYGEQFSRPHYHGCIFGYEFSDKQLFKESGETRLFVSPLLADLWRFGNHLIGDVTFESAAYVARYVVKKYSGYDSAEHYLRVDERTGEVVSVEPEFALMSRRPGIGRDWYDKFNAEVFPRDEVIVNGKAVRPPKYYDNLCKASSEAVYKEVKDQRADLAWMHRSDNTPERLAVRRKVREARTRNLIRSFESGT